jgi:hypothetical protein
MLDHSDVESWTPSYCAAHKSYNKVSLNRASPVIYMSNQTEFRTDDLRKIFSTAISSVGDITRIWYITVGYRYTKEAGDCHGWAYLDTGRFHISLPHWPSNVKMNELCQIIQHEIDHCLGLNHVEMLNWWKLKPTWNKELERPRKRQ